MNEALAMPGVTNAWTMPIKARIDMLTTGVRTPLGVKVLGSDLGEIEKIGEHVEMALKGIPGTTQCFCRTYYRRLLPGFRPQAGSARPLWSDD